MARIFNGTSHYLRVTPAVRNALPLSYAAWVKPAVAAQTGGIVTQSDEATTNSFTTLTQSTAENFRSSCRMGTSTTRAADSTTTAVVDEWVLLVATHTSDVLRHIYANGVLEDEDTVDAGTFTANYDNLCVGGLRRSTGPTDYFGGKIHSVAVWSKALSAAEVAAMARGVPIGSVARADLVGYWPDLGDSLVGVVGGTLVDIVGTTTVDGDAPPMNPGVRKVYALSSVAGLKEWVDYLPVKVQTSTNLASIGTYNDDGALIVQPLASVTGLTAWVDYTPVYVVADTNGWSYDDDGYLWVTGV